MIRKQHNTHVDRDEEVDETELGQETLNDFLGQQFQVGVVEALEGALPSMAFLQEHFRTKSARIRYLHVEYKMSVKDIAKHLSIRYQMVRNILTNELKRGPAEAFKLNQPQQGLPSLLKTTKDIGQSTTDDGDNDDEG